MKILKPETVDLLLQSLLDGFEGALPPASYVIQLALPELRNAMNPGSKLEHGIILVATARSMNFESYGLSGRQRKLLHLLVCIDMLDFLSTSPAERERLMRRQSYFNALSSISRRST